MGQKQKDIEAFTKATERNEEIYSQFQRDFKNQIEAESVEDGTSRIQLLEKMVHTMNSDIISSNMKYVGDIIESLDENNIIESKKENSKGKE